MAEAVDTGWEVFALLRDAETLADNLAELSDVYRDLFLQNFNKAGWDPVKMKQAIIAGADVPGHSVGHGLSFDPLYDEEGRSRV